MSDSDVVQTEKHYRENDTDLRTSTQARLHSSVNPLRLDLSRVCFQLNQVGVESDSGSRSWTSASATSPAWTSPTTRRSRCSDTARRSSTLPTRTTLIRSTTKIRQLGCRTVGGFPVMAASGAGLHRQRPQEQAIDRLLVFDKRLQRRRDLVSTCRWLAASQGQGGNISRQVFFLPWLCLRQEAGLYRACNRQCKRARTCAAVSGASRFGQRLGR